MSASASAFGRSASCSSKEAVTYSPFCSFRALSRSISSISRCRASSTRNGLPSLLACSFTTVSFPPIWVVGVEDRRIHADLLAFDRIAEHWLFAEDRADDKIADQGVDLGSATLELGR